MQFISILNVELINLRALFVAEGFDIRLVGGSVRDMILGKTPKDLDFCTNATPVQQKAIYDKYNIHCIDTGLQHGTWTVVLNHITYEITSLRIDTNPDGRHAEVQYVTDWAMDLQRRDLKFNAMSMTFDGEIFDPFDGQSDLKDGIVRFVGDANARLQEDYLRILRWYRFYARFGKVPPGEYTKRALIDNAPGLKKISRERVWMEMKQIIAHPRAYDIMKMMREHGIFEHIDFPQHWELNNINPEHNWDRLLTFCFRYTNNPVVLLALYAGKKDFDVLVNKWKLSNEEASLGRFVIQNSRKHENPPLTIKRAKELLTEGVNQVHIFETLKVNELWTPEIETWKVPVFPIKGEYLMPKFVGPELGKEIKRLRNLWYYNDFSDAAVLKELVNIQKQ